MSPAPGVLRCPACPSGLNPFFASGVPVHRCLYCGGTWIPKPSLHALLERDPELTHTGPADDETCPECDVLLKTSPGAGADVHACPRCGGLFLSQAAYESLTGKQRLSDERAVPRPVEFDCAVCGARKSATEAKSTPLGLCCEACTPEAEARAWRAAHYQEKTRKQLDAEASPPRWYSALEELGEIVMQLFAGVGDD